MEILLSLIQTSQNRKKELKRFVASLNAQEGIDFNQIQLIFIDQEDNKDVFKELNAQIDFTYISYKHCSLSLARNIGLKHVKGEYVGFPDDDCWYEPDTLKKVLDYLNEGAYQGITGKGTDEKGRLTSIFPEKNFELDNINRCAAISYTMFFKHDMSMVFDEDMGVGSPYNIGAGEETDFLLTLMNKNNYKVFYDSDIIIHHPTGNIYNKEIILKRTYSYSRGSGYLLKKHKFPLKYKLKQFVRPLCGMIFYAITLRLFKSHKSFLILKGRIEGYNWIKS